MAVLSPFDYFKIQSRYPTVSHNYLLVATYHLQEHHRVATSWMGARPWATNCLQEKHQMTTSWKVVLLMVVRCFSCSYAS
jgi:hypothetical protein